MLYTADAVFGDESYFVFDVENRAIPGVNSNSLTEIVIPDTIGGVDVETIGEFAFVGCTGLTSITIPDSVTDIEGDPFNQCSNMTAINVDCYNAYYSSYDGVLFNKSMTEIIRVPAGIKGAYTIPSGVTTIGDGAFSTCKNITSITIPNTVTYIGSNAFAACKGLTGITLPKSVKEINNFAFNNCTALSDVYYAGNKSEWSNVTIWPYGNDALTSEVKCVGDINNVLFYTLPNNLTYDGTARQATAEITATGYGTVTIKYNGQVYAVGPVNAGTYVVKIDIAETDTYSAISDFEIGTFTITKAAPNLTAPTAQNVITYGATLSTVGLPDGWTWADENTVPNVTNSGYVAYYTPADTDNYDWTVVDGWNASENRVERTVAVTVNKGERNITFEVGEGTVATKTMVTDANGRLSSLPTPTRKNYTFLGWFLKDGTPVDTDMVFETNTTVYAHWQIKSSALLPTWQEWELIDKIVAANKKKDEPVETEPTETEPEVTEPTETEPEVTEPTETEPEVTEPTETEPEVTEPTETEPQVTEPTIEPWDNPFADVSETDAFFEAVKFAYENGYMNGMSTDTFAPGESLTRGMLVTVLYRAAGSPVMDEANPFTDVADDAWYYDAVIWAKSIGLVTGITETEFAPEDEITREQLLTIFYRYANFLGYDVSVGEDTNILSYEDFADIAEYAIPALQWACGMNLIENVDGNILPKNSATRALVAMVLFGFCA